MKSLIIFIATIFTANANAQVRHLPIREPLQHVCVADDGSGYAIADDRVWDVSSVKRDRQGRIAEGTVVGAILAEPNSARLVGAHGFQFSAVSRLTIERVVGVTKVVRGKVRLDVVGVRSGIIVQNLPCQDFNRFSGFQE